MVDTHIPLSIPNISALEQEYTGQALADGWVSTGGSFITQFESDIAQYVHVKGAVACQSGTAGLHLALLACDVAVGQEVIVPTLTFVAAVNPVKYVGAQPVFMDCDDSLCMDMNKLEQFILQECNFVNGKLINRNSKKQVTAVIVVHVFGNLADMERLCDLAAKYNLRIIEDATEALGSYYKSGKYAGQFAGTIGDVGVYSFNGNKIVTTGGGGMVVSNALDICQRCKYLSTQAKDDELYFIHGDIGYNYRMTNVQAAIGVAQLKRLDHFIETKTTNFARYEKLGVSLLPFRKDTRPNYWFYSYVTEKRDEVIRYLQENKIQSRPIWYLIHKLEPYKTCQSFQIEKADYYWNNIVNLPCSSNLLARDVERVAQVLQAFNAMR